MLRRTARGFGRSIARIARSRDKAAQLRVRAQQSQRTFMERHQARATWYAKTFRAPMIGLAWLFKQASSLWMAMLAILGMRSTGKTIRLEGRRGAIKKSKQRSKFRGLMHEALESRQLLAADLWVNDNWDINSTLPEGAVWQSTAFSKLQDAISQSSQVEGSEVEIWVYPGEYQGDTQISLSKKLSIVGKNDSSDPDAAMGIVIEGTGDSSNLRIMGGEVSINNLTLSGSISGISAENAKVSLEDVKVINALASSLLASGGAEVSVKSSTLKAGANGSSVSVFGGAATKVDISNSVLSGGLRGINVTQSSAHQVSITGSDLSSYTNNAIVTPTESVIDASSNYWGESGPTGTFTNLKVDVSPHLKSVGTNDSDGSGYVPNFSQVAVNKSGYQQEGLIQEAIDVVTVGGIVNVPAGDFAEQISITKPLSLIGAASSDSPTIGRSNALTTISSPSGTGLDRLVNVALPAVAQETDFPSEKVSIQNINLNAVVATSNATIPAASTRVKHGLYIEGGSSLEEVEFLNSKVEGFFKAGVWVQGKLEEGFVDDIHIKLEQLDFLNNAHEGANPGFGSIYVYDYNSDLTIQEVSVVGNAYMPLYPPSPTAQVMGAHSGIHIQGARVGNTPLKMGTVVLEDVDVSGNFGFHMLGIRRYIDVQTSVEGSLGLSLKDVVLGGSDSSLYLNVGAPPVSGSLRFDDVTGSVSLGNTAFLGLGDYSVGQEIAITALDTSTIFDVDATQSQWAFESILNDGDGNLTESVVIKHVADTTLAEKFAIENRILHYVDRLENGVVQPGFVTLVDGQAFVSDSFGPAGNATYGDGSIQRGIASVPEGGIVHISAGSFNESVTINKPVSLIGAVSDGAPAEGARSNAATTMVAGAGIGIGIKLVGGADSPDVPNSVSIDNINIVRPVADGSSRGVLVESGAGLRSVKINNSRIENFYDSSVLVLGGGVGNSFNELVLSGLDLPGHIANGATGGTGGIIVENYNGDLRVENVKVTGISKKNPSAESQSSNVIGSHSGIQVRGIITNGSASSSGLLTFKDVDIAGAFSSQMLGIHNYNNIGSNGSITFDNVELGGGLSEFYMNDNVFVTGSSLKFNNVSGSVSLGDTLFRGLNSLENSQDVMIGSGAGSNWLNVDATETRWQFGERTVNLSIPNTESDAATLEELFLIENRILHNVDRAETNAISSALLHRGFVTIVNEQAFVSDSFTQLPGLTSGDGSIQRAIDVLPIGGTVHISAGEFLESVVISKGVNLVGSVGISSEGEVRSNAVTVIKSAPDSSATALITVDLTPQQSGDRRVSVANVDLIGSNPTLTAANAGSPTGKGSKYGIEAISGSSLASLTVLNANISNHRLAGIYIESPNYDTSTSVLLSKLDLANNSHSNSTSGNGGIYFHNYNGDATVSEITIVGNAVEVHANSIGDHRIYGSYAGIQFSGNRSTVANSTTYQAVGDISLQDVRVLGTFGGHMIGFQRYNDVAGTEIEFDGVLLGGDASNVLYNPYLETVGASVRFKDLDDSAIDLGDTTFLGLTNYANSQDIVINSSYVTPITTSPNTNAGNRSMTVDAQHTSWNLDGTPLKLSVANSADLFAIENRILHNVDRTESSHQHRGFVTIQENTAFVSDSFGTAGNATYGDGSIQRAIDNVGEAGTVYVSAGSFVENVVVPNSLTIAGAMSNDNPGSRTGAETTIAGSGTDPIFTIKNGTVKVAGFTLSGSATTNAAISIEKGSVNVSNNIIESIEGGAAIQIAKEASNVEVTGNYISGSKGGVNVASESNGHNVAYNDFKGNTAADIKLAGSNSDITITNNEFDSASYGVAIAEAAGAVVPSIKDNAFLGNDGIFSDYNVTAESNWWGAAYGPTSVNNPFSALTEIQLGATVTTNVDFVSWRTNSDESESDSELTGFRPSASLDTTAPGTPEISLSSQLVDGTYDVTEDTTISFEITPSVTSDHPLLVELYLNTISEGVTTATPIDQSLYTIEDADGKFVVSFDPESNVFANDGRYSVSVKVTDQAGNSSEVSSPIEFIVDRTEPELDQVKLDQYYITEGDKVKLSGEIKGEAGSEIFTLTVDWGDGVSAIVNYTVDLTGAELKVTSDLEDDNAVVDIKLVGDVYQFVITRSYMDDGASGASIGVFPISVHITDSAGRNSDVVSTKQLFVFNAAPKLDELGTSRAGLEVSLAGAIKDPGTDSFTLVINWGDGTIETKVIGVDGDRGLSQFSHLYPAQGIYPISLTIVDDNGGYGIGATSVNLNPVVQTHDLDLSGPWDTSIPADLTELTVKLVEGAPNATAEIPEFRVSTLATSTDIGNPIGLNSFTFDANATVSINSVIETTDDLDISYDNTTGELSLKPSASTLLSNLEIGQVALVMIKFNVKAGEAEDTGNIVFKVVGTKTPLEIADDAFVTNSRAMRLIDLLSNDSEQALLQSITVDGKTYSITADGTKVSDGTAEFTEIITSSGVLVYVGREQENFYFLPNSNSSGVLDFTYTIHNNGSTASAQAMIIVQESSNEAVNLFISENLAAGSAVLVDGSDDESIVDMNVIVDKLRPVGSNFSAPVEILIIGDVPFEISSEGNLVSKEQFNFELLRKYEFKIRGYWGHADDGIRSQREIDVVVNLVDDVLEAGPKVLEVRVNSTSWTTGFRNYVNGSSYNGASVGYAVPTGVGQQDRILPWVGINQIQIQFSEDVSESIDVSDLTLLGRGGVSRDGQIEAIPRVMSVSYDQISNIATFNLDRSLDASVVKIKLNSEGIVNLARNSLDGEWIDNVSEFGGNNDSTNGDDIAGGDFLFTLNVLPGSVRLPATPQNPTPPNEFTVLDAHRELIEQTQGATLAFGQANGGYVSELDLNGDGKIDAKDARIIQGRVDSRIL